MRTNFLVKVNFLVLALVLVVFAMGKLRSKGLGDSVASVFGMAPSAPSAAVTTLDWCETRVVAIERPNSPTLRQVEMKWILESEPKLELNFVAVEKWFAKSCKVRGQRLTPQEVGASAIQPAMVVSFVKGAPETLYRAGADIFRWKQELFRSPEMNRALSELETLPKYGSRTSN